jgi:hypothetical protein
LLFGAAMALHSPLSPTGLHLIPLLLLAACSASAGDEHTVESTARASARLSSAKNPLASPPQPTATDAFVGDFDGNGDMDIARWLTNGSNQWNVALSIGSTFTPQLWGGAWGSDGPIHAGDLNGDGKSDTFMFRASDDVWTVNLSNGSGFDGAIWNGAWGTDGPNYVGDVNGDGMSDVFMWRDADKVWTVNVSTGSGWNAAIWTGAWGSDGPTHIGDLDGDGKTDVFMWRDADKVWTVNLSTGSGWNAGIWTGAWGSDGPINVGDLNGDGKTDVFMWRDADKVWTVNLSNGSGFDGAIWTGDWGSDGPINVGDLNGDGMDDVFMWRGDVWTVNISTGSGFAPAEWTGLPGSIGPIHVEDVNGDGMADVVMFDAANDDWAINLSNGSNWSPVRWPAEPRGGPNFSPPTQFYLPYNGGDLMGMPGPVNIYLLFYGTWDDTQRHYFVTLAQHIGDSAWYGTLGQYRDHTGTYIHTGGRLAATYDAGYSHGTHIDDGWATRDLQSILGDAFNDSSPQKDPNFVRDSNGVYMMLLSPDVSFTSSTGPDFSYCAYHAASLVGAQKYAALPAAYAGGNCAVNGPTGTFLDSLADSFVHELAEAITDPDTEGSSGYYNSSIVTCGSTQPGGETGDICNCDYGLRNGTTPSGRPFNVKVGDQFYELQSLLTMSYPSYTGYCNVIGVQSAVYGDNCTSLYYADLTTNVAGACNGKPWCSFNVDPSLLGGYAGPPSCQRQLTVQWACWDGPHIATLAAEASGQTITLSCP